MKVFLIILISVLAFLLVTFIIYLSLIATSSKRRREMAEYKGVKFAHRGLHGDKAAENSMSAFKAAIDKGYGIEFDVRLSKDGEVVVFHDDTLDRLCKNSARVDSKTLSELKTMRLNGTADTIPTLKELLAMVDGRVPLLIELKEDAYCYGVTEKTFEILRDYKGKYVVESFNPLALARLRELMPKTCLGLLCERYSKNKSLKGARYIILQNFLLNFKVRPDFVAYNHEHARYFPFKLLKFFFRPHTSAWTVRTPDDEAVAIKRGFNSIIFEGYLSDNKKTEITEKKGKK